MHDQRLLLEPDFEASAIDRVYSEAEAGRGSMLVVEGPAGIGKTSVLASGAAEAAARGMRVLRATDAAVADLATRTFGATPDRPTSPPANGRPAATPCT